MSPAADGEESLGVVGLVLGVEAGGVNESAKLDRRREAEKSSVGMGLSPAVTRVNENFHDVVVFSSGQEVVLCGHVLAESDQELGSRGCSSADEAVGRRDDPEIADEGSAADPSNGSAHFESNASHVREFMRSCVSPIHHEIEVLGPEGTFIEIR